MARTFVAVLPLGAKGSHGSCRVGIELVALTKLDSRRTRMISWTGVVMLPDDTKRVLLVRGILSLNVGKFVCTLDVMYRECVQV